MSDLRTIQQKINQVIEDWFKELVGQLTSNKDVKPRGLWDRIKTGLTNLWWQTNAKQNPYKWVNRFGDLGVAESFCPVASFTLSEYLHLKETIEETEKTIVEAIENPEIEKLRLFKILSGAKENLKSRLINVLAKELDSREDAGKPEPTKPAPEPEPTKPASEPESTKPASEPEPTKPASEPEPTKPKSEPEPTKPESEPEPTERVPDEEEKPDNNSEKTDAIGTAGVNDDNASAEVVIGGKDKRKTPTSATTTIKEKAKPAQNIQKLVDEAVSAKKSGKKIEPDGSWLDSEGYVLTDKYPMLVAWLSNQGHKNPRVDLDFISALRGSSSSELRSKFKGIKGVNEEEENKGIVLGSIKRRLARYAGAFERMLTDMEISGSTATSKPKEKTTPVSSAEKEDKAPADNIEPEPEDKSEDKPGDKPEEESTKSLEEAVAKFVEECESKKDLLIKLQQRVMIPIAKELVGEQQEKFRKWFGEVASKLNKDPEYSKDSIIKWISTTEGPEKTASRVNGKIEWKVSSFFAGIKTHIPNFNLDKFKDLIANAQ